MKRILLLFAIFPAFVLSQDYDFRKTNWGMTMAQVRKSERDLQLVEKDDKLMAMTSIAGNKCFLMYKFEKDKLTSAIIRFNETHSEDNLYIDDFTKIASLLKDKYGEPNVDEMNWSNKLYSQKPEKYGFAVSAGHLILFRSWLLDRTIVSTELKGDNFKIKHYLYYFDKANREKVLERQKSKTLEEL